MMTRESVDQIMQNAGIPSAFLHFDEKQTAPYLIALEGDTENASSDFDTHRILSDWFLELYYRDIKDRWKFEDYLMSLELVWDRDVTDEWIDGELVFESRYVL